MAKILLIVLLVIVALVLIRVMFLRRVRNDRPGERFVTEATGRVGIDARPLEHEVIGLLERGKKIQAIKLVREHTRLGLAEAKNLVEEVERTGRLRLPPERPAPTAAGDVLEQARHLKRSGRAIEAIKLIRRHTGMGLREAKEAYDRL